MLGCEPRRTFSQPWTAQVMHSHSQPPETTDSRARLLSSFPPAEGAYRHDGVMSCTRSCSH
ncbi:hypothetical protein ABB07_00050 [Streptomyces incarnatus]|uniref:Uncharacterized protein n=1 Tax=Streptomyces incarnatus TaxID=665007 RepID=A0ABN4G6U8_9ACTN|nr:hypothetical protein ABB07_00050 [Streptomyces incarnatus]